MQGRLGDALPLLEDALRIRTGRFGDGSVQASKSQRLLEVTRGALLHGAHSDVSATGTPARGLGKDGQQRLCAAIEMDSVSTAESRMLLDMARRERVHGCAARPVA